MKLAKTVFLPALIPFLGIIIYFNTFQCSFQFDDLSSIIDNPFIKNIHHLQLIWDYLPRRFLLYFTFALNYYFDGLHVFGYHLINLSIHLVSSILVWWLVLLTLSTAAMKEDKIARHANLMALFAGLIFVSHPIQTEAVTYIVQRAASMATMFYLASLCLYIKSKPPQHRALRRFYYIGSLLTAVAAMFTKETAITLPLMILLYEYCFFKTGKDLNWKHLSPFLLTLFIIPVTILLTESAKAQQMRGLAPEDPSGISPIHYLLTQFRVMITYIRLLFLPLNQNLDYDYPTYKSIFELPVLFSFLFLMIILFYAKRLFLHYRLIAFSIFWFFLTLSPESSLKAIRDVIAEHRLYLPMVGYSIFLVSSVYYLFEKNSIKVMVGVLTVIVVYYSILTYQRNAVWKDEITMLNDVIQKSPHKERPYNNRGLAFDKQGNLHQAIADFTKAIDINPLYTNAYINRGFMYNRLGDYSRAIIDYSKAIEINPKLAEAYINRGNIFIKLGNFKQAATDYEEGLKINPDKPYFIDAYYNLGFIYFKQGNYKQAVSNYSKFIKINPDDAEVYNNRAVSYFQLREYDKAWEDVNKAEKSGGTVNPQLINALKQMTGKLN